MYESRQQGLWYPKVLISEIAGVQFVEELVGEETDSGEGILRLLWPALLGAKFVKDYVGEETAGGYGIVR